MFSPEYIITNKTLSNLIGIEVAGKVISLAPLQTEWEGRLRQEALIKNIFSLARFVGNALSIDDVAKIVKDEPSRDDKAGVVASRIGVIGKEKDIQQILNLLNATRLVEQLAYLAGKFKQGDFGEKDLSQIHLLMGERLMEPKDMGKFRDHVEVPFQIEDLFGWYKNVGKNEIHPVNKAGVMFYELQRINPFQDNNLSTALLFFQLTLLTEGYGLKRIWSFNEEVLKSADVFKISFDSVERNGGALTVWLEFLTRCLSDSAEKAQTKVLNLVGEAPIFKSDGGKAISLTERQIVIMEEMTLKNEMTIKEIRSILPMVSDDTILRDLKGLIDKKLLRKKGKTKGALYVIGKIRSYR